MRRVKLSASLKLTNIKEVRAGPQVFGLQNRYCLHLQRNTASNINTITRGYSTNKRTCLWTMPMDYAHPNTQLMTGKGA